MANDAATRWLAADPYAARKTVGAIFLAQIIATRAAAEIALHPAIPMASVGSKRAGALSFADETSVEDFALRRPIEKITLAQNHDPLFCMQDPIACLTICIVLDPLNPTALPDGHANVLAPIQSHAVLKADIALVNRLNTRPAAPQQEESKNKRQEVKRATHARDFHARPTRSSF